MSSYNIIYNIYNIYIQYIGISNVMYIINIKHYLSVLIYLHTIIYNRTQYYQSSSQINETESSISTFIYICTYNICLHAYAS